MDTLSLNLLRAIELPRTETSIRKLFRGRKVKDPTSNTGLGTDSHRRKHLFTKMTTEEYNNTLEVLIELDKNYVFPKLKNLTNDNGKGAMAIANQLGMHVCRWLQPGSMQEAKNTPVNSRPSIHTVLSAFQVIANHPTDEATIPLSPADNDSDSDAGITVPTSLQRATLTHFEDALCELATTYQVHFTNWASENKQALPVESLVKETVSEYRRRFTDSGGWRALMELVVTYFGADSPQHEAVSHYVVKHVVSTFPPIQLLGS